MYQDQIARTIRLFNLKLSRARRAIRELSIGSRVNYVPELKVNSLRLECRTIVEHRDFNLSLRNEKFESVFTTLSSVYHIESEDPVPVHERLDTLFRICTGEAPVNLTDEELLNESIHAFSKTLDQYPLLYNEYNILHPKFFNGSSISETDYAIAFRKAGISESGALNEEILRHYREYVEKLVEIVKNMR